MARPKSHQQKIVEIVEVEVARLHAKALGDGGIPAVALTADDLDKLEVLARINKLIQVQLPKAERDDPPPDPKDAKAMLRELQGRLTGKDIQPDEE